MQGHNAFQFVDVGAAHDREYVHVRRTHAFERHAERMVGVQVREFARVDKLFKRAARSTVTPRILQRTQANHCNDTGIVDYEPGMKATGTNLFHRFFHGHVVAENFRGRAHRAEHAPLAFDGTRFRTGEWMPS